MTNTPSLPPGGEKQADQVEAVAAAIWHARADHFGEPRRPVIAVKDERWELCLSYARAALSASKPLVVEECARVADRYCQPRPDAPDFELGGGAAARSIARDIRALKESPSEGSGG